MRTLKDAGLVRVGNIANRSKRSAQTAVAFIGDGTAVSAPLSPGRDDWLLFGVPEGNIGQVVAAYEAVSEQPPKLAFHLSGAIDASVLAPLGCPVAAVHPVRAFVSSAKAARPFAGTWCVMEGCETALTVLEPVFTMAGGRVVRLGVGDKRAYHAATVAASNFLVTLNDMAAGLAARGGLEPAQATDILYDLQLGTLENLRALGAAGALTGPIERGDVVACRALLAALPAERRRLFQALGAATVPLARIAHPDREWAELEALFDNASAKTI